MKVPHLGGPADDTNLKLIVKPYLERIYELRGDDPQNISETELQLMMLEAKIFQQVRHTHHIRQYTILFAQALVH